MKVEGSRITKLESDKKSSLLIRKPSEENESVHNKQTVRRKESQIKKKSGDSISKVGGFDSSGPRDHDDDGVHITVDDRKVGNSGVTNQTSHHSIMHQPAAHMRGTVQNSPVFGYFSPFRIVNKISQKNYPVGKPKVTRLGLGLPLVRQVYQSSQTAPSFNRILYPTFGHPVHPPAIIRPFLPSFLIFPHPNGNHFQSWYF